MDLPYFQCKNVRLYYRVDPATVKKDPDTIILLHNNISDHTLYDTILPYINRDYTILRCDLRGFGKSEPGNEGLTYDLYVEDLYSLVKSMNLTHFHLAGSGFSALVALRFTSRYNSFVGNLFLISMASNPTHFLKKIKAQRKKISQSGSMIPSDYIIQMGTILPPNHPVVNKWRPIIENTNPTTYYRIMELSLIDEPVHFLESIQNPTLILAGDKDILFPQHDLLSKIERLPHCRHVTIPGASSFIMLDKPAITALLILDFINDHPTESAQIDPDVEKLYIGIRDFAEKGAHSDHSNPTPVLKVDLLHTFRVFLNGKEITTGWNKRFAKELLIYLLFYRPATREQICDTLWPNVPLRTAKKNLSVYLSYLKNLINKEGELLKTDREYIHLTGHISSDALVFLKHLQLALNEQDPKRKFTLGQELLNKVPLSFTPAVYNDWFLTHVDQVKTRMLDLILWMAEWLIHNGKTHLATHHLKNSLLFFKEEEALQEKLDELS